MNFIYDSLETVKNLKFPTKKEFIELTVAVFVVVIIAGIFFIGVDTVLSLLHQAFHTAIVK